jgi:preprotein translocase subunit SecD
MSEDPIIAALAAANPHPGGADPANESGAARTCEQIISAPAISAPSRPPRRAAGGLIAVASVVIVIVVAAFFLHAGGTSRRVSLAPAGRSSTHFLLRLEPSPAYPHLTAAAVGHELALLRFRVRSLGASDITIRRLGTSELRVTVLSSEHPALVARYLTTLPQLVITDWEASVLAPDGRPVASQNLQQDPAAQLLSQGAAQGPGAPDAGAVTLEHAVALAAHQQAGPRTPTQSRIGSEWFAFARTGPGGCHASTFSCYRAGPTVSRRALDAQPGDQELAVPQGTIITQATSPTSTSADYRAPSARFFALRDRTALTTAEVSGTHVTTDSGQNAISVSLTARGTRALQTLTASIARRGRRLGVGQDREFQHFAIVLDGALLTVPSLNYNTYPDGIVATHSSIEIVGGFSRATAQSIATVLLPLNLKILPRS